MHLNSTNLFNEKIYSILYYKLLKKFCWRGKLDLEYTATVCEESNLNVNVVLDNLRRLCKGGRINVKFADYVAGILRKVNKKDLEKLENYIIVFNKLQKRELIKAFRLENKTEVKKRLGIL